MNKKVILKMCIIIIYNNVFTANKDSSNQYYKFTN